MKINTKAFPFTLAFVARTSAKSVLKFTRIHASPVSFSWRLPSGESLVEQTSPAASAARLVGPLSIYAVDELPRLTELYSTLLEAKGYLVRTFNHRAKALAALKACRQTPALMITNYRGRSMPLDQFIQACRVAHPSLLILMASGLDQSQMRFSRFKPDRFIQKPFTPEELQQAVKAALAAQ